MSAQVTVAIVSWNTRELLRRCLESFEAEADSGRCEVWVIDNASDDGSAEMVRNEFPWVNMLASSENLGFGAAVNEIARHTDAPWIVPANADIELTDGALDDLLSAGRDPRVGIVAPRLVLEGDETQHSVHRFPTVWLALLVALGVYRLPGVGDRLCIDGYWRTDRPRRIDWAHGAFLLIRREAFDVVTGFDPQQWLYAEDIDIHWRVREAGYVARYEPAAVVRHALSAAAVKAFGQARTRRHLIATYAWQARRFGLATAQACALVNAAGAGARWVGLTLAARLGGKRHELARNRAATYTRVHLSALRSRRTLERAIVPPEVLGGTRGGTPPMAAGSSRPASSSHSVMAPAPDPEPGAALAAGEEHVEDPIAGRFEFEGGLRGHTARGVIINGAFQVGFAGLGLLQRFAAAAFLTTTEFGIWGLVLTTLITLSFLKQIGISDKYIQQDERDQELAFQKAFTFELLYTLLFSVAIAVVLPLYALIYGRPEMLLPSLVLTLALLGSALNAPLWIPLRKMQFVRQRLLEAINPVVSTIVMVGLAIAGAGYWALIGGMLAGVYAAALVAWITCPYKLRFRFDRALLREYVGFSWPLLIGGGSGLLVVQGTMIVANHSVGLAGVGAIALAGSLIVFAQRVDSIISRTIYPAICAVKDRSDLLFETFVKSNRLSLMWGLTFGVGLALFAPDLVEFVLGERWEPAAVLLQGLGLLVGLRQLGFNWTLFLQATGNTRPIAAVGVVGLVTFAVAIAPAIVLYGLDGYVAGLGIALAVELCLRAYYLTRMFRGFRPLRHLIRAFAPSVPAVASVLIVRALGSAERSLGVALGELALYLVVTVAGTLLIERRLLREVWGYLRRGTGAGRSPNHEPAHA